MTAAELIALAERVEGLTGPCRETDGEIEWLLQLAPCDISGPFTASLDAALGLVPEGHYWALLMHGEEDGFQATCTPLHAGLDWRRAATPALALTAAALRARAAEIADGKGNHAQA